MTFNFLITTSVMASFTWVFGAINHRYDTEPVVNWTPPKDENEFKDFGIGANYSGLLFAGWNEFNWVVDLRTDDIDQELWAVGNLVSHLHVLTTARAVDGLQAKSHEPPESGTDKEYGWNVESFLEYSNIRVHFCQGYLHPEWDSYIGDIDVHTAGSRSALSIIRHPKRNDLAYDVAVIIMTSAIPTVQPQIGTMPTGFDYTSDVIKEYITLDSENLPTYASPVCFVGSFGKNYVNHKEFFVLDYKVKFRVYVTPWADCRDAWKYICSPGDMGCGGSSVQVEALKGKGLYCMRPRAKVGTVCDHDKGAPLVCNGQVIGLVVRGVKFRHCNNRYKIPFIVERLSNYARFVDDTVSYVVHPVSRKMDVSTSSPIDLNGAVALAGGVPPAIYLTVLSTSFLSSVFIPPVSGM